MRELLHVLTRTDPLAADIITRQQSLPDHHVIVVDLTQERPDYARLLQALFAADSVAVW